MRVILTILILFPLGLFVPLHIEALAQRDGYSSLVVD